MDQNNVLIKYLLQITENDCGVDIREKIAKDYEDALIEEEQKELLVSTLEQHQKTKLGEEKFTKLLENNK